VVEGIKSLHTKVADVGKNLVTGLWNGINNKFTWLKNKIKSFTSGVLDGIKSFFGVNSPSRETAWIGEMLDEGLAQGVTDAAKVPVKAMQKVSGSVLNAAQGDLNGLQLQRSLATRTYSSAPAASAAGGNSAMLAKLDGIYERLGRLQMVTDTGALVGEMLDAIDAKLSEKQRLAARGVY
jgi:phage-related protein